MSQILNLKEGELEQMNQKQLRQDLNSKITRRAKPAKKVLTEEELKELQEKQAAMFE